MVGGVDQDTGHQVCVSPQVVNTLFCGGAEHFYAFSRGTQQEPAYTTTMFYRQKHGHKPVVSGGARHNNRRKIQTRKQRVLLMLTVNITVAVLTLFRNTLKYQKTSSNNSNHSL